MRHGLAITGRNAMAAAGGLGSQIRAVTGQTSGSEIRPGGAFSKPRRVSPRRGSVARPLHVRRSVGFVDNHQCTQTHCVCIASKWRPPEPKLCESCPAMLGGVGMSRPQGCIKRRSAVALPILGKHPLRLRGALHFVLGFIRPKTGFAHRNAQKNEQVCR